MANAPDLSLRGRFAPMAISPTRSGQCRGADSRARRRTCNLYKPPSKWQTLPTCHCEEQSDVAISQYYVGYHESSGENVTAFPRLHPKGTSSRFALRAPRPLRGLAMTRPEAFRILHFSVFRIHSFPCPTPTANSPARRKKSSDLSIGASCWRYLSSRAVTRKVLSAQMSLTSVFGMETGVPSPQSTPTIWGHTLKTEQE